MSDFYPRSPCGERLNGGVPLSCFANFYPRSPCGERLATLHNILKLLAFLSTLSLRRATIRKRQVIPIIQFLSTLSLRRATIKVVEVGVGHPIFLSTLSLRRATHCNKIFLEWIFNFYPRSPCGERPARVACLPLLPDISIHALLAESDDYPA